MTFMNALYYYVRENRSSASHPRCRAQVLRVILYALYKTYQIKKLNNYNLV